MLNPKCSLCPRPAYRIRPLQHSGTLHRRAVPDQRRNANPWPVKQPQLPLSQTLLRDVVIAFRLNLSASLCLQFDNTGSLDRILDGRKLDHGSYPRRQYDVEFLTSQHVSFCPSVSLVHN
ncbi:unnamed protein product [Sphenostylis stenocarpa]|uniref:Uncharacterized protein n=1 Tax=Sphenostylis stenocarpa TaxID=92480 RepID=A0AA86STD1_9FABA|nr:unnamed protein product [Sphenostylis stenocarpa]